MDWVNTHAAKVTVRSVLNTPRPHPQILMQLLYRCRFVAKRFGTFRMPRAEDDKRYREQVREEADRFNFHISAMRSYNPSQVGEMIKILLEKLALQGINASIHAPQL